MIKNTIICLKTVGSANKKQSGLPHVSYVAGHIEDYL